jgi:hypothetical protein
MSTFFLELENKVPLCYTGSHLKNVFWPPAFFGGIGASFQILDIQKYACGFKLGPAAILNQNPIFEMASNNLALTKCCS